MKVKHLQQSGEKSSVNSLNKDYTKDMLTKNLQLLSYLTKKHPHASVTVLIKLCYLVDLVSIKNGSEKISNFTYIRYFYGPFDKSIYTELDQLLESGVLIATPEYKGDSETIIYSFNEEKKLDTSALDKNEIAILDEVLDSLDGYGAKALTDVAYSTAPMQALNATLGGDENLGVELNLNLVRA
ncbi:MAG: Panacea domain-containing protein [Candidatus Paceibacterota bacterium]